MSVYYSYIVYSVSYLENCEGRLVVGRRRRRWRLVERDCCRSAQVQRAVISGVLSIVREVCACVNLNGDQYVAMVDAH